LKYHFAKYKKEPSLRGVSDEATDQRALIDTIRKQKHKSIIPD